MVHSGHPFRLGDISAISESAPKSQRNGTTQQSPRIIGENHGIWNISAIASPTKSRLLQRGRTLNHDALSRIGLVTAKARTLDLGSGISTQRQDIACSPIDGIRRPGLVVSSTNEDQYFHAGHGCVGYEDM